MPDLDHVDALGKPAPERSLDDAIAVGRAADLLGLQADLIDIDVLVMVHERPSLGRHDGGSLASEVGEKSHAAINLHRKPTRCESRDASPDQYQ